MMMEEKAIMRTGGPDPVILLVRKRSRSRSRIIQEVAYNLLEEFICLFVFLVLLPPKPLLQTLGN